MRAYHRLVFDDSVNGTTSVYTHPRWNKLLALTELIEIGAVITRADGTTPTLTVQAQVSPDNQNWFDKSGTAEIDAASLSTTDQTIAGGKTSTSDSTVGFVRLKITLGGTTPKAHMKIYVTGRGEQVLDSGM
jgi:hypothetical protein